MIDFVKKLYYNYIHIWDWREADWIIEIIIWAILTQQTKRENVKKILEKIKIKENISWFDIESQKLKVKNLKFTEDVFIWINFYKKKFKIISSVLNWFLNEDFNKPPIEIRKNLLKIKWIWKETADCILCYWFNMRFLPIDYYTYKVLDYYIFKMWIDNLKKKYPYDELAKVLSLNEFNLKTLHWAFVEEWKKLKNKK